MVINVYDVQVADAGSPRVCHHAPSHGGRPGPFAMPGKLLDPVLPPLDIGAQILDDFNLRGIARVTCRAVARTIGLTYSGPMIWTNSDL